MAKKNIVAYLAESNKKEEVLEKHEVIALYVEVEEMRLIGLVSELNDQRCLGSYGKSAIVDIIEQYDIDAVVVVTAADFSKNTFEVCECVGTLTKMGVEVISINDDLPKCEGCDNGYPRRANHCTVKIFHE